MSIANTLLSSKLSPRRFAAGRDAAVGIAIRLRHGDDLLGAARPHRAE